MLFSQVKKDSIHRIDMLCSYSGAIYFWHLEGAPSVMVIVVINGHSDWSKNPRRGCWHFKLCLRKICIQQFTFQLRGEINKFPGFFCTGIKIVPDSWKYSMLLLHIIWDYWPIFYDFRFKGTATAGIGIHPTKAWLSLPVNFKNAIWTWGHLRTMVFKLFFATTHFTAGPKCQHPPLGRWLYKSILQVLHRVLPPLLFRISWGCHACMLPSPNVNKHLAQTARINSNSCIKEH